MQTEQSKKYILDPNLDSYRSFFDHDWAKRLLAEADVSGLEEPAFDLCEGWKGAANTARLPWLLIEFFAEFAESFSNSRRPYAAQFLDAVAATVSSKVHPCLSNEQQQGLRQGIDARAVAFVSTPEPYQ